MDLKARGWSVRLIAALALVCVAAGSASAADGPVRMTSPASPARADSTRNGTLIGAVIGGAVMAGFFKISADRCRSCENDLPGWLPFVGTAMGAAAGGTIGYFVDKAHRRRVAISPGIGRRHASIRVAVRF